MAQPHTGVRPRSHVVPHPGDDVRTVAPAPFACSHQHTEIDGGAVRVYPDSRSAADDGGVTLQDMRNPRRKQVVNFLRSRKEILIDCHDGRCVFSPGGAKYGFRMLCPRPTRQ